MKWLKKAEDRIALIHACESAIAAVVSYYACFYFGKIYSFPLLPIAGLWGAISAFMVLGAVNADVNKEALNRVIATTTASILSLIVIYTVGYNVPGLATTIFVAVIFLGIIKQRELYRSTCITAAVIFVVGIFSPFYIPPWLDCFARLIESFIGVGAAVGTVYLFHPIRHRIG